MKQITHLLPLTMLLAACTPNEKEAQLLPMAVTITPDYTDVTLPPNLAPIRFALTDSCQLEQAQAIFEAGGQKLVLAESAGQFAIDSADWKNLIGKADTIRVRIQGKQDGKWVEYQPFKLFISADPIDPYMAYRLIEPGYEVWGEMGIYQRCLETYDEEAIITNLQTDGGCMNCHSFQQRDPEQMLFHLRKELGGTYMIRKGQIEKLNTKTDETVSALVYPSWHPSGRYVAFSTNITQQAYHSTDVNRIEVFDKESDVVIYDTEQHEIFSCPQLKSKAAFETFPTFSADGTKLYYCSADSLNVLQQYDQVRYALCAIDFNDGEFGSQVDTLYHARPAGMEEAGSVSFPRVSPDGRWLLFTVASYGQFSIWHRDADLWMIDFYDGSLHRADAANSQETDSYHSWSSNSRWVAFSSRRIDGLYTRPYLTHVDADGRCTKAVLVPQRDVHYYDRLMKSYNIPELISGHVDVSANAIEQTARHEKGIDLKFNPK